MAGTMPSTEHMAASKQRRTDAAPTELGAPWSACAYKHGAPNGAFRIAATTIHSVKNACKEQHRRAHSGPAAFLAAVSRRFTYAPITRNLPARAWPSALGVPPGSPTLTPFVFEHL